MRLFSAPFAAVLRGISQTGMPVFLFRGSEDLTVNYEFLHRDRSHVVTVAVGNRDYEMGASLNIDVGTMWG